MQVIENLRHLTTKVKIQISNIGVWQDSLRVTEKTKMIFSDKVM